MSTPIPTPSTAAAETRADGLTPTPRTLDAAGYPSDDWHATAARLFECSQKLERELAALKQPVETRPMTNDEKKATDEFFASHFKQPAPVEPVGEPYAHEWQITIRADSLAGAIAAACNCADAWARGSEPLGGATPASMGERNNYDVRKTKAPTEATP